MKALYIEQEKLGTPASTISRYNQRYEQQSVLATADPGQPAQKLTPQLRVKVLERTRQTARWFHTVVTAARWQR